ncbi:aromatic ring-hydroxylating oxygenase subunit alpha [Chondromyces apiculatus]|uniref:Ferredoxin subunits of nitrite reductase and ring-hydroxylating dioxygenase n=1 Tax=Chondromyces apiculatus DSM 436 TaxID=1192034 RepID=A0A017SXQ7_9BACT|nr:aromatic ring-hydroxylating dioxygenase subunit alpha [Chondromyces apiculatus]EYF01758.1 ferredoxin subunits of nitrite reductase and ring-hydroxylating dioxygenase [Chondromyces apiculatus DSM 436]
MSLIRIAKDRYLSREFMLLEQERLWARVWLLAGHAGLLDGPGSFFTFETGAETLLVTRGEGGEARAFHNVCQHRGTRLCAEDQGRAARFRCPYHAWTYGLDGALLQAPGVKAPREALPRGLPEVRCEVLGGFVWVCLADDPEPLETFLGPLLPRLLAYEAEAYRLTHDQTVEIACNWKTSADVSNEAYHLRVLHPELCAVVDDTQIVVERLGLHGSITVPIGAPSPGTPHAGTVAGPLRELLRQSGLDPAQFAGNPAAARPALLAAAKARAGAEGMALRGLDDTQLLDKHQYYVFPNVQLNFTLRTLEIYRHRPHPHDPQQMYFDEQAYERASPGAAGRAGARAVPARRRIKHGEAPLGPVMGADVDLLPELQRGMASRGVAELLLTEGEAAIETMHRGLDHYLFGAEGAAQTERAARPGPRG